MKASKLNVGATVYISDFFVNGVKFTEKFKGRILKDNGDGTIVVQIKVQSRFATTTVGVESIS